jgi:hypothetical protein
VLDGRAIGGMAMLLPTIISDTHRVVVKLSLTKQTTASQLWLQSRTIRGSN